MQRTMLQLNLKDCAAAIAFYQNAFGAVVDAIHRDRETGDIMHAEIRAFSQCIAFSERAVPTVPGNTMQFCFHFGPGHEAAVEKAYACMKDGAEVDFPLGPCDWSPMMFSLTDTFGVHWCLFV